MKPRITFLVYSEWNLDTGRQRWIWKIARTGHYLITSQRDYETERGARLAAKRMLRILNTAHAQQLLTEV